jgi:hypothetical protein
MLTARPSRQTGEPRVGLISHGHRPKVRGVDDEGSSFGAARGDGVRRSQGSSTPVPSSLCGSWSPRSCEEGALLVRRFDEARALPAVPIITVIAGSSRPERRHPLFCRTGVVASAETSIVATASGSRSSCHLGKLRFGQVGG